MCGRFALTDTLEEVFEEFSMASPRADEPEMPPRYNIAPTQPILIIGTGENTARESLLVRWGLMPSWVKDPDSFTLLANARCETATEKPSFRNAMRHRRILIPVNGFYEWQRFGKDRKSQPYWVKPRMDGIVALGGLMETWCGSDGTEIDTACILTTQANGPFSAIHHRLPLVIQSQDYARWLDCKTQEPRHVSDLMVPAPDDYFDPVPVSDIVNKVSNSSANNFERVELPNETQSIDKPDDSQLKLF